MISLSSVIFVLYIIFVHWVADFIFQDEQWALNKSKNNIALLKHTVTYTSVFCIFLLPLLYMSITSILYFGLITLTLHTLTDYITSRITSKKYAKGHFGSKIPNLGFFTVIGFDQILHYTQLFLTLYFLCQPPHQQ